MNRLFNNTPNTSYIIDNKEVWVSRSAAVVAIVIAIHKGKKYVLAEKRSETMPDAPGKWVVPGGYIDYDESGWNCLRRELYEETSFFLDTYEKNILFDNDKQPFFVKTEPDENRQNIALNYCVVIKFFKDIPRYVEDFKDSEISKIRWLKLSEIDNSEYEWAFNHKERIKMALTKYNSKKWKIKNLLKRLRILITHVW